MQPGKPWLKQFYETDLHSFSITCRLENVSASYQFQNGFRYNSAHRTHLYLLWHSQNIAHSYVLVHAPIAPVYFSCWACCTSFFITHFECNRGMQGWIVCEYVAPCHIDQSSIHHELRHLSIPCTCIGSPWIEFDYNWKWLTSADKPNFNAPCKNWNWMADENCISRKHTQNRNV